MIQRARDIVAGAMPTDPPKPDVTDEMPTLRELDKPGSDAVPTPHRPDGKVILGGDAADDAVAPNAGKTQVDAPKVAMPAGTPVARTLPSVDESDIAATAPIAKGAPPAAAQKTAVEPPPAEAAARPTVVTRAKAAPAPTGSVWLPAVLVAGVVLAALAGGAFLFLRSRGGGDAAPTDDRASDAKSEDTAPAPKATETAASPGDRPAETATPTTSAETPSDAASSSPTAGGGAGTKPTATASGLPTAMPSGLPSWVPTSIPTALPTAIPTALPSGFPTSFPFPTATATGTTKPTSTSTQPK
jgi:hypothetical protein